MLYIHVEPPWHHLSGGNGSWILLSLVRIHYCKPAQTTLNSSTMNELLLLDLVLHLKCSFRRSLTPWTGILGSISGKSHTFRTCASTTARLYRSFWFWNKVFWYSPSSWVCGGWLVPCKVFAGILPWILGYRRQSPSFLTKGRNHWCEWRYTEKILCNIHWPSILLSFVVQTLFFIVTQFNITSQ